MKSKRKSFIVLMVMVFVLGIMGTVYAATDGSTTLPAAINGRVITGVSAPAYTAIPVIAAAETAEYTAAVSWSPDDNSFAANTVYTATITLTPNAGYTLTGVSENYFEVPGATTVTNDANSGVITAVFPATAVDLLTIKGRAITGVRAPAYAATPVKTATETDTYTAAVTWLPTDTTFAANTVYTATIALAPKTGYTLTGVPENYFKVPGATTVTNDANSGVVTAVFPATATDLKTIKGRTITGVKVPAYTATPVTTATETAKYTAAVTWSPDDNPFAANTVYTATIILTPKEGYTLTGVPENYFKVPGATTVTNDANSGVITAVFPATGTFVHKDKHIGRNNEQKDQHDKGQKCYQDKAQKDQHDKGHKGHNEGEHQD